MQIKPLPKEVLGAILARLEKADGNTDRNQTIRENMMITLADHGVDDPSFVRTLGDILDDPKQRHGFAAMALSRLGKGAKPAEAALRRIVATITKPSEHTDEQTTLFYAQAALNNLARQ